MYKQESEILEQIRSFHKRLSKFYNSLKEKAENQKVIMLLDYLSRHEKLREEFLVRYIEIAPENVMKRWFQKPSGNLSNHISNCFESIKTPLYYSLDDVIEMAFHFDDCLIKVYESLAMEEEDEHLTSIFYSLMKKTKQQEMNLSRDINWLYDI